MNQFARIIQGIGWLGVLGLAAAALGGRGSAEEPSRLAWHTSLVVAATAPVLLAHLWTLGYLWFSARSRRALAPAEPPVERASRAARRVARVAVVTGLVLLGSTYLLARALLWRQLPLWLHGVAAWTALVAQVAALLASRRALALDDRAQVSTDIVATGHAPASTS